MTFQSLKMVATPTDTTMYLTDTGELENTTGAQYGIQAGTTIPGCSPYTNETVALASIVDSREITVTRAQGGSTAVAHCNEDYFYGPLNRSITWAVTIVDSTHFSVPLDSSTFGSFAGQGIRINRSASASAGPWPIPYMVASGADGAPPALEIDPHGYEVMTIDGCPDKTNAIRCSFGYLDVFNQKNYLDSGATGSLVVSGGTGTFTLTFTCFLTCPPRTVQANELIWLWNFSDSRVNRPWVTTTVTGTCSSSCVITIANMGTGQGGTGVPDGTYTITGTYRSGNGFFFPLWASSYMYFGPGLAVNTNYPTEYPNSLVKGTYNSANNRYRAWYCWGITGTAQPLEFGSYVTESVSNSDGWGTHGYHQIAYDTYGSTGACQWQLWEINDEPYHWVNYSALWLPQSRDSTWTGWVGYGYPGGQRHYFDGNRTFYMNLISTFVSGSLAQTSYMGPMYMDDVSAEPDEWTIVKAVTYNPGGGTYRVNVVSMGFQPYYGPCSSLSYEFYHSTSELKALGLSSATYDGLVAGVSYGVFDSLQMNLTTGALPYGNMYFGVRPRMCISGVSGSGQPIQLSFRQDPNMQVGDHVTLAGIGGNTNANQSSPVQITAVTPRQFWYRSNQGYSVSPTYLTGITVTGGNTCTVNFTVAPNVFVGQEVGLTGFETGVVIGSGPSWINFTPVTSVGTGCASSTYCFTVSCPSSTTGTYNGDYGGGSYLGVVADPAITISGTGNANWDGNFTGTMVSTENTKNFSEMAFTPPSSSPPSPSTSPSSVVGGRMVGSGVH